LWPDCLPDQDARTTRSAAPTGHEGDDMALWDQLKQRTQEMSSQLQTKAAQFKSKDFANASMAMCALIAASDGSIDPSERSKVAGLIGANDVLSVFPPSELRDRFDHYCNKLSADYDFGKVEAVQAVAKLKPKPDQARAVIQIGIIIGGADGNFDKNERAAVKDACFAVGINPTEFDL
jgi:tellurite resistance protein TerB